MAYEPQPNTSVSSRTLRIVDLLRAFSAEYSRYEGVSEWLLGEAEASIQALEGADLNTLEGDDILVESADDVLEALFEALNEQAPSGCYFGAHPGDGADFGYWEYDEDTE